MRNISLLLALGAVNLMTAGEDSENAGRGGARRGSNTDNNPATKAKGKQASMIEGDQYVHPDMPEDSTLAVTEHARDVLVINSRRHEVDTSVEEVTIEGDIIQAFTEAIGTTNVDRGKLFTAMKSNVYKAPGGHGQRAMLLSPDGKVTFLPDGTKYKTAYEEAHKSGAIFAICYFDQSLAATNPHARVSYYFRRELPEPAGMKEEGNLFD